MKVDLEILLKLARPADELHIRKLLEENGLLVEDLPSPLRSFFVCRLGGEIVGAVGLEYLGEEVLLRSLVVTKAQQNQGLGRRLVWMALGHATANGAKIVYLLTTDAEEFFLGLGFQTVERNQVPESIRQTRQFRELCSKTAKVMKKELN